MHELSLTEGILAIVRDEQRKNGFARVLEISLRIGEFSGVIPSCMEEFFPIASKGSCAEGAVLRMEMIPGRFRCRACGAEGAADRKNACCLSCGSRELTMTAGREFYIENISVE